MIIKALKEGPGKRRKEEKIEMAKSGLKEGLFVDLTAKLTGLSEDAILKLKR